jgi:hypothetical protein
MGRTYAMANHDRIDKAGKDLKGGQHAWLTASDERVRASHIQAGKDYGVNGDPGPIGYNQPFIINGEKLMHPRDPNGSPENVINCRCEEIFLPVELSAYKAEIDLPGPKMPKKYMRGLNKNEVWKNIQQTDVPDELKEFNEDILRSDFTFKEIVGLKEIKFVNDEELMSEVGEAFGKDEPACISYETKTIYFNAPWWEKYRKTEEGSNDDLFFQYYRHCMLHEAAHYYYFKMGRSAQSFISGEETLPQAWEKYSSQTRPIRRVSEYATHDAKEHYAEFVSYLKEDESWTLRRERPGKDALEILSKYGVTWK